MNIPQCFMAPTAHIITLLGQEPEFKDIKYRGYTYIRHLLVPCLDTTFSVLRKENVSCMSQSFDSGKQYQVLSHTEYEPSTRRMKNSAPRAHHS